jgi:hypothetical protein
MASPHPGRSAHVNARSRLAFVCHCHPTQHPPPYGTLCSTIFRQAKPFSMPYPPAGPGSHTAPPMTRERHAPGQSGDRIESPNLALLSEAASVRAPDIAYLIQLLSPHHRLSLAVSMVFIGDIRQSHRDRKLTHKPSTNAGRDSYRGSLAASRRLELGAGLILSACWRDREKHWVGDLVGRGPLWDGPRLDDRQHSPAYLLFARINPLALDQP